MKVIIKDNKYFVETRKGEVEVPAILEENGTLNIDLQFIPKKDLL